MKHRALVPALVLAASAPSLAACAGRSPITFNTVSTAADSTTILTCAAEVAVLEGLPVISRQPGTAELRASSSDTLLLAQHADTASTPPAVDVLTVSFGARVQERARAGLRVFAQTMRLGAGAPDAGRATWSAARPSMRVALARDAILARCGNLTR